MILFALFILLMLVVSLNRMARAQEAAALTNESQLASFYLVKAEAILRYRMELLRRR